MKVARLIFGAEFLALGCGQVEGSGCTHHGIPTGLFRSADVEEMPGVADDDGGFVTDYQVTSGNPEDGKLLVGAIERHRERLGQVPAAVAVDRGMASAANDAALARLGVTHRCLPKQGPLPPAEREKEHRCWFRQLQRFRAGGEARISLLKRKYGWRRSRLRGLAGVQTWVGWGTIALNLTKYARLQTAPAA